MTTQSRLMTAEDLLAMPDDGKRHELIQGVLKTMAPAGDEHGVIASRVSTALISRLGPGRQFTFHAAETGFLLPGSDRDTVRAPDFAVTRRERREGPPSPGFSRVIPDLVVEVVSPSDRASEVAGKVATWLAAGCAVVVVVDPGDHTVRLIRSTGEQVFGQGSHVSVPELDGVALPVDDLFTD
jgi:Uma2 family endonuclease